MERDNVALASKKGARLKCTFCFWDESGFSERPTVRRTWGKRGMTPVIRSTGSWKNISATGIVATDAHLERVRELLTFTQGGIRKENTVETLQHLLRHLRGPLALFWDGLAQHWSKVVRVFLKEHKHRFVIVERFPAYAPELNPQEPLWASSKTRDMAGFCPKKKDDLLAHARKSMRRIQHSPDVIRGALYASGLWTREGVR